MAILQPSQERNIAAAPLAPKVWRKPDGIETVLGPYAIAQDDVADLTGARLSAIAVRNL